MEDTTRGIIGTIGTAGEASAARAATASDDEMILVRHYVKCAQVTDTNGVVTPLWVEWDDGRTFKIDRVLARRGVSQTRYGGSGTRYTAQFGRHVTYLYRAGDGRWYVEVKVPQQRVA